MNADSRYGPGIRAARAGGLVVGEERAAPAGGHPGLHDDPPRADRPAELVERRQGAGDPDRGNPVDQRDVGRQEVIEVGLVLDLVAERAIDRRDDPARPGQRFWVIWNIIILHIHAMRCILSQGEGGISMGIRVAVAGASGYAGGELLRLLAGHPDLEIAAVSAGSSAGKPITSIHPNLIGHPAFDGKNFETTTAQTLGDAELIFMALPHGESAALAARLPGARIVDLSADFRLGDEAAWHQFYPEAAYAGRWAYGLPELRTAPGQLSTRNKIKAARTVAAPGCYATTSILALAPLLAAG
ncbi:MAG: hypothetical protein ACRDOI_45520, partial [Trebonia sp.]